MWASGATKIKQDPLLQIGTHYEPEEPLWFIRTHQDQLIPITNHRRNCDPSETIKIHWNRPWFTGPNAIHQDPTRIIDTHHEAQEPLLSIRTHQDPKITIRSHGIHFEISETIKIHWYRPWATLAIVAIVFQQNPSRPKYSIHEPMNQEPLIPIMGNRSYCDPCFPSRPIDPSGPNKTQ